MHLNAMFFELIFVVKAWCFAAVGSSREAVVLLKLLFAIHALESGDSRCEEWLVTMVVRKTKGHGSELCGQVHTQIQ